MIGMEHSDISGIGKFLSRWRLNFFLNEESHQSGDDKKELVYYQIH